LGLFRTPGEDSVKPGDLVVGKAPDGLRNMSPFKPFRAVKGILLERIHYKSPNKWWSVLCDDGLVVEETEEYIALLSEAP